METPVVDNKTKVKKQKETIQETKKNDAPAPQLEEGGWLKKTLVYGAILVVGAIGGFFAGRGTASSGSSENDSSESNLVVDKD